MSDTASVALVYSPADGASPGRPVRSGRSLPRSRNGCFTCRGKAAKKRCDERRPICGRCDRLGLFCDYNPRPRKSPKSRSLSPRTQSLTPRSRTASPLISTLSVSSESACSLSLNPDDHEAIRFFRTAFAELHHTKNPAYSCIAIMFDLAEEEPMIMHMVLALGFHEMDLRRPTQTHQSGQRPTFHYSTALRLLADTVGQAERSQDLDSLFTTLWLMMLYEQQFGTFSSQGCSNHLKGAASLLQHKVKRLLQADPSDRSQALTRRSNNEGEERLSLYTARMLIWISHIDAAAASSGIGGEFSRALISLLFQLQAEEEQGVNSALAIPYSGSQLTPVDSFLCIHRYSNPLYRTTWGDAYPQAELLDDLENRNIFNLITTCSPLRFMVAQIGAMSDKSSQEFRQRVASVEEAIQRTNYTYMDLLEVSREISIDTDHSHRLVANIRYIVPMFYAIQLDFLRITQPDTPLGQGKRQQYLLKEIMNLAFQSYRHWGDDALIRIAWPLFTAGLETDDPLHRGWILEKFQNMSKVAKHLERAYVFLKDAINLQRQSGMRVDVREMMQDYEGFILT